MTQHLQAEQEARRRFHEDVQPHEKAEFIHGEIIHSSPDKRRHIHTVNRLIMLVGDWLDTSGHGGWISSEKGLVALTRNSYEPDFAYWGPQKAARQDDNQEVFDAPDLIVEVLSPSTEKRDRGIKMEDYALHSVAEYWLIDTEDYRLERYLLGPDNRYGTAQVYGVHDSLTTDLLPELRLPVEKLFLPYKTLKGPVAPSD